MADAAPSARTELRDIAHRLRNELHAISLAGVVIGEVSKDDEELKSTVEGLINSCARARQLTETLLICAQAVDSDEL